MRHGVYSLLCRLFFTLQTFLYLQTLLFVHLCCVPKLAIEIRFHIVLQFVSDLKNIDNVIQGDLLAHIYCYSST